MSGAKLLLGPDFQRTLDRLKKKYPHVQDDIVEALRSPNIKFFPIPGFHGRLSKVRVPSRDMQRGKSGGFRLISYVAQDQNLHLLTIYAKSELEDLPPEKLIQLYSNMIEWVRKNKAS